MTRPNPWPFPSQNEYAEGSAYHRWNEAIKYIVDEPTQKDTEEWVDVVNTELCDFEESDPELFNFEETTKEDGTLEFMGETDPNGLDLNSPGAKADAGKNRVWLFMAGFSRALEEVSKVTTVGATKYTPNGWVDVPNGQARYMDAFGRHMLKLGSGELMDDGPSGTGCYHKAQMIWNLLAAFELELRENES